jgi:hypothetical protein
VPLLQKKDEVRKLLEDSLSGIVLDADGMAVLMIERLGKVACKTALRLAERAVFASDRTETVDRKNAQLLSLTEILDDLAGDEGTADLLCEVM